MGYNNYSFLSLEGFYRLKLLTAGPPIDRSYTAILDDEFFKNLKHHNIIIVMRRVSRVSLRTTKINLKIGKSYFIKN